MASRGNTITTLTLHAGFMTRELKSTDYFYHLPESRIATHPLSERDQSKLLVYDRGTIRHERFSSLPELVPTNSSLFFNDTKVIPARLIFHKPTGAQIEVFLLQHAEANKPVQLAMSTTQNVQWYCSIGNLKRWKEGAIQLQHGDIELTATLIHREQGLVQFSWTPKDFSFGEVIGQLGAVPLPPYLRRPPEEMDRTRYQTVYSHHEGAVAAPTAGLHFTDEVIEKLKSMGVLTDFLTLHVSAGTFQPIKTDNALDHVMHAEQIIFTRANIEQLLLPDRTIIAVGTTAMRSLESLYWYGVKILRGEKEFHINQNDPYLWEKEPLPHRDKALNAVLTQFEDGQELVGQTSIYIVPGYKFRLCQGLITNFHQPGSTLMLLVAAFVGEQWRAIYDQALAGDYRFLSYGDSSLLIP